MEDRGTETDHIDACNPNNRRTLPSMDDKRKIWIRYAFLSKIARSAVALSIWMNGLHPCPVFAATNTDMHLIHGASRQELDDFTLTAYVLDERSTGKTPSMPGFGITSTGTRARIGRTVAVDPSVIPYGTVLYIDGIGTRVAEDTGGAVKGKHIDVLVPNNKIAMAFGVKRHVRVYTSRGGTR